MESGSTGAWSDVDDSDIRRVLPALLTFQAQAHVVNRSLGTQLVCQLFHADRCHSLAVRTHGVEFKAADQLGEERHTVYIYSKFI